MNSGQLRHRIEIQAKQESRDSRGGVVESWNTVGLRWASIEPLRPRELFQAQQVNARVSHRILMRHYAGLTDQHRLRLGSRIFHLMSPLNINERRRMSELLAMEEL
jgi:SPP1 family predicted phage head-tail adaptor